MAKRKEESACFFNALVVYNKRYSTPHITHKLKVWRAQNSKQKIASVWSALSVKAGAPIFNIIWEQKDIWLCTIVRQLKLWQESWCKQFSESPLELFVFGFETNKFDLLFDMRRSNIVYNIESDDNNMYISFGNIYSHSNGWDDGNRTKSYWRIHFDFTPSLHPSTLCSSIVLLLYRSSLIAHHIHLVVVVFVGYFPVQFLHLLFIDPMRRTLMSVCI